MSKAEDRLLVANLLRNWSVTRKLIFLPHMRTFHIHPSVIYSSRALPCQHSKWKLSNGGGYMASILGIGSPYDSIDVACISVCGGKFSINFHLCN